MRSLTIEMYAQNARGHQSCSVTDAETHCTCVAGLFLSKSHSHATVFG